MARFPDLPPSLPRRGNAFSKAFARGLLSLFGWPGLTAEMVRRQNRDLVFDDSPLRRALAWSSRPFEPTATDFEVPQYARSLQLPDPQP